jgi:hypothetical protein
MGQYVKRVSVWWDTKIWRMSKSHTIGGSGKGVTSWEWSVEVRKGSVRFTLVCPNRTDIGDKSKTFVFTRGKMITWWSSGRRIHSLWGRDGEPWRDGWNSRNTIVLFIIRQIQDYGLVSPDSVNGSKMLCGPSFEYKMTSKMVSLPDITIHQDVVDLTVDVAKITKEVSHRNTNFQRPLLYTY